MKVFGTLIFISFLISLAVISPGAHAGEWSESEDTYLLADGFNIPTAVVYNDEYHPLEVQYHENNLADISPAAGLVPDAEHNSAFMPDAIYLLDELSLE